MKRRVLAIFLSLAMICTLAPAALAAEAQITAEGGELTEGTYTLSDDITLTTANLTIPADTEVIIDLNGHTLAGNGNGSVITVYGSLTLRDSTAKSQSNLSGLTAGTESNGDGTYTVTYAVYDEDDTLSYCTYTAGAITGGVATTETGGGIHVVAGGSVSMYGGVITGNAACELDTYALGGGIYLENGTGVDDCAAFVMYNGAVSENVAYSTVSQGSGAGAYIGQYATFTMYGGVFSGNAASGVSTSSAGAVYVQGNGNFTASDSVFSDNTARLGGAIYGSQKGTTTLTDCVLVENTVTLYGGAIAAGHLTMTGCVVSHNNSGTSGGGLYITGGADSSLENCYIQYNKAAYEQGSVETPYQSVNGGGISTPSASTDWSLSITECTIRSNTASAYDETPVWGGGAFLNSHTIATITDTSIIDNTAAGQTTYGGGIGTSSNTQVTLTGDTSICENEATGSTMSSGGGIYMGSNGTVTMESGTISGNTAGQGGGVTIGNGSGGVTTFNMSGGTISGNTATGASTSGSAVNTGGGVLITHWSAAECNLSGNAIITGNVVGTETANDLCLYGTNSGIYANLTDELTDDALIGINIGGDRTESGATIVQGSNYTVTTEDLSHVVYNGEEYAPYLNSGSNAIQLTTAVTVTFNPNGGDGTAYTQKVPSGQTTLLTANTFTRTDYTFEGWSSTENGSVEHTDEASVTFSADTALYAIWKECKHTGGKAYTADGAATLTQICADCGHVFGTATVTAPTELTYDGSAKEANVTTTSGWEDDAPTITYVQDDVELNGAPTSVGSYTAKITMDDVTASVDFTIKKATPEVTITPSTTTLTGSGTVELTVSGVPTGGAVTVTQNDNQGSATETLSLTSNGEISVSLSNTTATYTFTVSYDGDSNYAAASDTCTVSVTRRSNGSGGSSSSSSTTRTITVEDYDNGSVTSDLSSASSGSTVTLTISPDDGYELDELTVTNVSTGKTISVTQVSDTEYTFTMPAAKVTIEATFVESENAGTGTDTVFVDVDESAYYYDAVLWAVENGITTGTSTTTFSPDLGCTRAQMVTFLWRAAGSPVPSSSTCAFTDLDSSDYYYTAVLWAVENGITNGTTETTFSPDDTVTRSQTVTLLYRYEDTTSTTGTLPYADVSTDAYYYNAVLWANENAITNGTSSTTFSPEDDCTRAQIVTFMYRYMA